MNDSQYSQDIIDLHRRLHARLREQVAGLDTAALNWTPAPETSSIGVAVVHMLGAHAEMLRNLLGIPTDRVRDEEFAARMIEPADLDPLLAAAEADWAELATRLTATELRTAIPRPNKPTPETGLFWLVRDFGHMSEHLAQIELTRQLYRAQH